MSLFLSRFIAPGFAITGLILWSGCGDLTNPGASRESSAAHSHEGHDQSHGAHNHDRSAQIGSEKSEAEGHTHVGPSGRRLIVLGEDEYHADLAINPADG